MKTKKFLENKKRWMVVSALVMSGGAGLAGASAASAVSLDELLEINPVYQEYEQDVINGNGSAWALIPNRYRATSNAGRGAEEILPTNYSLIESGYGTTIKNQGLDGDCWAFALTTSIESNLKKNGINAELAPKQMDYLLASGSPYYNYAHDNYGFTRDLAGGGNFAVSSIMLGGEYTPVNEAEFFATLKNNDEELNDYASWKEYNDTQMIGTMFGEDLAAYTKTLSAAQILSKKASYVVTDYRAYGADSDVISKIKEDVYNNGAVWVGTYAPSAGSGCYDETTETIIDRGTLCSSEYGHAMAIVGWDDTHVYNDNGTEKQGAFLIQNSWGSSDLLSSRGITYDALVNAGKIDESAMTDERKELLRDYIDNYDADEFVWLGYDFETSSIFSTIDFGTIKTVKVNDYEKIYDILDAEEVNGEDTAIEWVFKTQDDDAAEFIDAIALGTVAITPNRDMNLVAYVDSGNGYEMVGETPINAGDYGQGLIQLDEQIEVKGDFKVKLMAMVGDNAMSGLEGYATYFKATVYAAEEELAVPSTGEPEVEDEIEKAPSTGWFTGEDAGANITGTVMLIMTLMSFGIGVYACKGRKHLFNKIDFTKK